MKVSIVQGGGFVPVVTTTVADAASLSPADAGLLAAKVDEVGLFDLQGGGAHAGPDEPSYQITVEHDGRRNQVVLSDAALPAPVRDLISWVGEVPGHQEQIGPIGG